jgi:hypothetical protein
MRTNLLIDQLVAASSVLTLPALAASADDHAGRRFLEFFTATARKAHTRRAYARAVSDFLA